MWGRCKEEDLSACSGATNLPFLLFVAARLREPVAADVVDGEFLGPLTPMPRAKREAGAHDDRGQRNEPECADHDRNGRAKTAPDDAATRRAPRRAATSRFTSVGITRLRARIQRVLSHRHNCPEPA